MASGPVAQELSRRRKKKGVTHTHRHTPLLANTDVSVSVFRSWCLDSTAFYSRRAHSKTRPPPLRRRRLHLGSQRRGTRFTALSRPFHRHVAASVSLLDPTRTQERDADFISSTPLLALLLLISLTRQPWIAEGFSHMSSGISETI